MTKYDYIAIAVLIALMVWVAADKFFPRDTLLSARDGIVFFFARHSAWGGIVSFIALAVVGLFYVKWSPYSAAALVAAQDHTLGASIVSGNLPASPEVSLQAGFAYFIAYLKAIWQALLLGLALGVGIEVLLPRARLSQFFAGWKGFAARNRLRYPLNDVHMLRRSDCSRDDRRWCRRVVRTSLLAR